MQCARSFCSPAVSHETGRDFIVKKWLLLITAFKNHRNVVTQETFVPFFSPSNAVYYCGADWQMSQVCSSLSPVDGIINPYKCLGEPVFLQESSDGDT